MKPETFFYRLLDETKDAFYSSPISKSPFNTWGAAVCDNPIKQGAPIMAGIHWGGSSYTGFQTEYPSEKNRNYTFLRNVPGLLKNHFNINSIDEINYTNVCFFRSTHEEKITPRDWRNTINLFDKYVDYVKPSYMIILGRTPIEQLDKCLCLNDLVSVRVGETKKRYRVFTAKYKGLYPLVGLPHPNGKIQKKSLDDLWKVGRMMLNQNGLNN